MRRMIKTLLGGVVGTLVASLPIILVVLVRGPGDAQGGLGIVFAFLFLAPFGMIAGLIFGFTCGKKQPSSKNDGGTSPGTKT